MTSPDSCNVCGCIPPNMGRDFFYSAGISVLCDILGAAADSVTGPDSCEPCGCVPGNMTRSYAKAAALGVMCQILQVYESE